MATVKYYKGGKLIYTNSGVVGFINLHTGMRDGAFAISLNARGLGALH